MEKPKIQWSCKRNKSSQHVGATQVELARAVHGLPLKNQLVKAECDVSNHNVFHIGHGKGAGDKHNMLPSFPYVWATGCKTFSKAISCRELCDFFHVLEIVPSLRPTNVKTSTKHSRKPSALKKCLAWPHLHMLAPGFSMNTTSPVLQS